MTAAYGGDDSDDAMLPLLKKLLAKMGWKPGNKLSVGVPELDALIRERLE